MKKIIFHSNRTYNNDEIAPIPSKKSIPLWFSSASKYWKAGEESDNYIEDYLGERSLGFKSCPALLDSFSLGYLLTTPCDLFFGESNGKPYVLTKPGFEDFCASREKMPEFTVPHGYYEDHFHWWPNWGIELEEGYSLLVISPMNRYDLPFLTVNGIIDSDKYTSSGLTPFFLKKGFSGIVEKGTPYAQVIPIKREQWSSEIKFHSLEEIIKKHNKTADKYRVPKGGIYKRFTWQKKEYN